MDQRRQLRVVMIGQHDSFGQILAANIRHWGYEAVVLPSTVVMLMNKPSGGVGEEIEADVLLYDLDEAFRISTLMGGRDMPTLFEGSCEEWWPHVRFMIALSSRSVSRMTLEQMGAVALLYKPFEMGRLQRYLRVLQKLFSGDEVLRGGVGETNARILVVDDDVHIADALQRCLVDEADYEVVVAHDGVEALEQYLVWRPDCIVTDLMMPWMNGYQIMRCLATRSQDAMPAFVVMSALPHFEVPLNSPHLTGNVVAYVDKPFHIDQLLRAVEQALRGPLQRGTLQDRMYMCP